MNSFSYPGFFAWPWSEKKELTGALSCHVMILKSSNLNGFHKIVVYINLLCYYTETEAAYCCLLLWMPRIKTWKNHSNFFQVLKLCLTKITKSLLWVNLPAKICLISLLSFAGAFCV